MAKLLVTLVEACDKRDFKPVLESAIQSNERRRETAESVASAFEFETDSSADGKSSGHTSELRRCLPHDSDLAKYHCTSAFHTFFPATLKPCKGYHFWCAMGTPLPIFDRLLREAAKNAKSSKDQAATAPIHDISDVALGFPLSPAT